MYLYKTKLNASVSVCDIRKGNHLQIYELFGLRLCSTFVLNCLHFVLYFDKCNNIILVADIQIYLRSVQHAVIGGICHRINELIWSVFDTIWHRIHYTLRPCLMCIPSSVTETCPISRRRTLHRPIRCAS